MVVLRGVGPFFFLNIRYSLIGCGSQASRQLDISSACNDFLYTLVHCFSYVVYRGTREVKGNNKCISYRVQVTISELDGNVCVCATE